MLRLNLEKSAAIDIWGFEYIDAQLIRIIKCYVIQDHMYLNTGGNMGFLRYTRQVQYSIIFMVGIHSLIESKSIAYIMETISTNQNL